LTNTTLISSRRFKTRPRASGIIQFSLKSQDGAKYGDTIAHSVTKAQHHLSISSDSVLTRIQKSILRDSKEISKPAVFAQHITLSELARSETGLTIRRKTYERTDENEYGFGWHCGND